MNRNSCSRRAFLRGAGGIALALPYLDRFAVKARAQSAAPPLRLVVVQHGQGMVMDRWTPSATGSAFELSELLDPLAAHKDQLLVLSGVDNLVSRDIRRGNAHNSAARSLLTGYAYAQSMNPDGTIKRPAQQVENGPAFGPSFEHVIAGRIAGDTPFPRFDLKVGGRGAGENQVFWADNQVPIEPEGDPAVAYGRLVGLIEPGAEPEPSVLERLRSRRGSVLDAVLDGFRGLMRELPAGDRERLEAHAEQLRGLERNLSAGPGKPIESCSPHAQSLPDGYDFRSRDNDFISAPAMVDNLVLALSCDLTRVATLQFTDTHAPTFSWLRAEIPGAYENWHDMIHSAQSDPRGRAALIAAQRWYTQQVAYLLDRLGSVVEADGTTLLDNTIVLWLSEFGNGGLHDTRELPIVLAGGGGRIATGRHLALENRTTGELYTALLQLFGGDDTSFGMKHRADGTPLVNAPIELG